MGPDNTLPPRLAFGSRGLRLLLRRRLPLCEPRLYLRELVIVDIRRVWDARFLPLPRTRFFPLVAFRLTPLLSACL